MGPATRSPPAPARRLRYALGLGRKSMRRLVLALGSTAVALFLALFLAVFLAETLGRTVRADGTPPAPPADPATPTPAAPAPALSPTEIDWKASVAEAFDAAK